MDQFRVNLTKIHPSNFKNFYNSSFYKTVQKVEDFIDKSIKIIGFLDSLVKQNFITMFLLFE